MNKTCEECLGRSGLHACALCEANPSIKKQTNADRIRAMTDEELAEYIIVMAKDDYCDRRNCTGRPCWQCRLEWLKKEVDDD